MSPRHPAEFKQKAVELVTIQRKSITQVCHELSIAKPTLYYWLNNQSSSSRTLASGRATMDPAQGIKRLRAQNKAMNNEVTKLCIDLDGTKKENRAAKP